MQYASSRAGLGGVAAALVLAHLGVASADTVATFVHPVMVAAAEPRDAREPVDTLDARSSAELVASPRRHEFYVEALGKGGLWGIGYAYHLRPWLALGAVGSYSVVDGQRLTMISPYAELYPVRRGHHGWFVDVGPQIAHLATPSPVPEWSGTSDTGLGAELSTGYEYRSRLLIRVFGMVAAGKKGVVPWLGLDLGWTL